MERRLVAILAADVVGYSAPMERDEAGTSARLKAGRKELFEPEIERHHGRVFKLMGDGLLAEFSSVVDAVECAVSLQRGLAERNASVPESERIQVRIGVNLGEVIVDGDDRYGEGVNIATRLEQLAEAGDVCVSGKVAKEVAKKLAFGFEAMGEQKVRNITEPVPVYRVKLDGDAVSRLGKPAGRDTRARIVIAALAAVANRLRRAGMKNRHAAVLTLVFTLSSGTAAAVTHDITAVNGFSVERYAWTDSAGRQRTVSLKREGAGNPGHGGYAVQMTYRLSSGRLVTVNNDPGDGFGYFVSHERYRNFSDGAYDTIAHRIFGGNDSPLGRDIAVAGKALDLGDPGKAAHRFTLSYPRYGTIDPIPKDPDGNDVIYTPIDPALLKLYHMPITITWYFEDGTDYPRIEVRVDFGDVTGPDLVNFDMRGPYGVMRFDNSVNRVVDQVIWGDRFHFKSLGKPAVRGSAWIWSGRNRGARYHALIAGGYEMGLFEPRPFARSALRDSFADERGKRSSVYNGGNGCLYQPQLLPCDWEWPYQSLQYSLPNNMTDPSDYKKIAWGSSPFYGSGPSLPRVYDSPTTSQSFNGFPASRRITYSVCLVLGATIQSGLTRLAAAGPSYNCAVLP